mmetsp:Transcript_1859/g.5041  ORF Transcript_1859/g.5041 Transcript_1859/m.5041 type:complete len:260 (+) Transcript_1859:360-1139(+)
MRYCVLEEIRAEIDRHGDLIKDDVPELFVDEEDNARYFSPEEKAKREMEYDALARRAEKLRDRMKKKEAPPTASAEADFHTSATRPDESIETMYDQFSGILSNIFAGGPVAATTRASIRPLTEDEKYHFDLRLLCDAAFQESTLRIVNFDFRSRSFSKWNDALTLLMVNLMDIGSTKADGELADKPIGVVDYADRAAHSRIRAVESIVADLRAQYDPQWREDQRAVDQRCIFALCAREMYGEEEHDPFKIELMSACTRV